MQMCGKGNFLTGNRITPISEQLELIPYQFYGPDGSLLLFGRKRWKVWMGPPNVNTVQLTEPCTTWTLTLSDSTTSIHYGGITYVSSAELALQTDLKTCMARSYRSPRRVLPTNSQCDHKSHIYARLYFTTAFQLHAGYTICNYHTPVGNCSCGATNQNTSLPIRDMMAKRKCASFHYQGSFCELLRQMLS